MCRKRSKTSSNASAKQRTNSCEKANKGAYRRRGRTVTWSLVRREVVWTEREKFSQNLRFSDRRQRQNRTQDMIPSCHLTGGNWGGEKNGVTRTTTTATKPTWLHKAASALSRLWPQNATSTLSQRRGRAPQPSVTWGGGSFTPTQTWLHKATHIIACNFGGVASQGGQPVGGGGVLHDNDDADVTP